MKFKFLLVLAMLIPATVFADFCVGGEIGLELGPYFRNFTSATYRSDEHPWCFSTTTIPFDYTVTATADNWFVTETIEKPVDLYFFWGMGAGVRANDDFAAWFGPRLGAGVDWFVMDNRNLEFYVQTAWNPYFGAVNDDSWDFLLRPLCFPFSTGARWWFR